MKKVFPFLVSIIVLLSLPFVVSASSSSDLLSGLVLYYPKK